jgi:hypothetical protein
MGPMRPRMPDSRAPLRPGGTAYGTAPRSIWGGEGPGSSRARHRRCVCRCARGARNGPVPARLGLAGGGTNGATPGGHSGDSGWPREVQPAALQADDAHAGSSACRSRRALRYLAAVGSRPAHFVSPEQIQSFISLVKDYLASSEPEFWIVSADDGAVMGSLDCLGARWRHCFSRRNVAGAVPVASSLNTLGPLR